LAQFEAGILEKFIFNHVDKLLIVEHQYRSGMKIKQKRDLNDLIFSPGFSFFNQKRNKIITVEFLELF